MTFLRRIMPKMLSGKKGPIQQCLDYVSFLTVGSTIYATCTIVHKQWKTSAKTPVTQCKYVLVGKESITQIVEKRIRYKMKEPGKPLRLFKSKFTEIIKIQDVAQFAELKDETKPICLCVCISAKFYEDHSTDDLCLPTDRKEMPKDIKQSIVVVKNTEDDPADVQKSVNSLNRVPVINEHFREATEVLQFSSDNYKDVDYKTDITLRTVALYFIAILMLAVRKGTKRML